MINRDELAYVVGTNSTVHTNIVLLINLKLFIFDEKIQCLSNYKIHPKNMKQLV
jgi:hypothetical protein